MIYKIALRSSSTRSGLNEDMTRKIVGKVQNKRDLRES